MHIIGLYLENRIKTGAHKRYLELLYQLGKKGHTIQLFVQNAEIKNSIKSAGFNHSRLHISELNSRSNEKVNSRKKSLLILQQRKRIKQQCLSSKVILVFGESYLFSAKILSLLLHVPLVLSIRSNFVEAYKQHLIHFKTQKLKKNILRKFRLLSLYLLEKSILSWSKKVIVQTSIDAENIMHRNPKKRGKIHVIPNSMHVSWFLPDFKHKNTSSSCRSIVYVGGIGKRKGFIFLFDAIIHLIQKGYDITLDVLGSGLNQKDFENTLSEDKQSAKRITFHGHIENVMEKLADYDLLVVPSIYDSFPNVVFEALFTGTPVIGSVSGGIPRMLKHSDLLFSPGSSREIEEIIEKCYLDTQHYLHIKELCRQRQAKFTFDWAERFISVLESV